MSRALQGIVAALDALGAWPDEPGKGNARCPAHDDRNPSLGIIVNDRGDVVLNCLAGCEPDAVLVSLGMGFADLFATTWEAA